MFSSNLSIWASLACLSLALGAVIPPTTAPLTTAASSEPPSTSTPTGVEGDESLELLAEVLKPVFEFLGDLDKAQFIEVVQLISNETATKAELKQALQDWAEQQPGNVSQQLQDILETVEEIKAKLTAKLDQKAEQLSPEALAFYQQYKKVYQNEDMSLKEECQEINKISTEIAENRPEIEQELVQTFKYLPSCPSDWVYDVTTPPPSEEESTTAAGSGESPSTGPSFFNL